MTEANTTEEQLANQFASFSPEALKRTYDDLNSTIQANAKPVSRDLSSLKTGLEALLPPLDEMSSGLSRKVAVPE